jgi:hypothetical protein
MPLREVYAGSRRLLSKESPIADLFLLMNEKYATQEASLVTSATDLVSRLLPGDQIAVRCGRLSHFATVWDIDRANGTLRLLDPFPQFWSSELNRCFAETKVVQYKHQRDLVQVRLIDLEKSIVAVLTVRDRKDDNNNSSE